MEGWPGDFYHSKDSSAHSGVNLWIRFTSNGPCWIHTDQPKRSRRKQDRQTHGWMMRGKDSRVGAFVGEKQLYVCE